MPIHASAAKSKAAELEPFEYEPAELDAHEVEIQVDFCGVCHSDLSMIDDEWGMTKYPLVPGHEVVGTVVAAGDRVREVKVGERVGLGWQCGSCLACRYCDTGREHLCQVAPESTIVGRHGGFADRVRCHERWAIPIPAGLDPAVAGPLLCGSTTVWTPILHNGVRPAMKAAVVGIGGLGHMALQILDKIGCEVTAITSTKSKADEAAKFGASHVLATRDSDDLKRAAGRFDFILSTVSADLPWDKYVAALAPQGTLCVCGVPETKLPVTPFGLILGEKRIAGGRTGSPADTAALLLFCAAKGVAPQCEPFPMAGTNAAIAHVRAGTARCWSRKRWRGLGASHAVRCWPSSVPVISTAGRSVPATSRHTMGTDSVASVSPPSTVAAATDRSASPSSRKSSSHHGSRSTISTSRVLIRA